MDQNLTAVESTKEKHEEEKKKTIRHIFTLLLLLGFIVSVSHLLFSEKVSSEISESLKDAVSYNNKVKKEKSSASLAKSHIPSNPVDVQLTKGTINSGDTALSLLKSYLPVKTILHLGKQCKDIYPLTRIRCGHQYEILTQNDEFCGFEYEISKENKLVIEKDGSEFFITKAPVIYDTKTEIVKGDIGFSLFEAVEKSGESSELAIKIAEIFAWDIDFIRDIRSGDKFCALVEKRFKNNKQAGYGKLQAVFFSNQKTTYKAFLYKDSNNRDTYYDENGNALRKAFLKAPLDFSRISSGYSGKRFHPVLKSYRPHRGIDYAAPRGTPIKTVGDGVVIKKLRDRRAGNYIKIRHKNGYETTYCHLTRYAKSIRKGTEVEQGQVIGYVGSTGYATGPHLCFRMKRYGKYVNPLRIKSPATKPVSPTRMNDFLANARTLAKQLSETANTGELVIARLGVVEHK